MSESRSLAGAVWRSLPALLLTVLCLAPARAQLQIDITSGVTAPIPIAVEPFAGETPAMSPVIAADLARSGRFRVQPRNAADYLVTGQVGVATDGAAAVDFELRNLLTGQVLLKERLTMPPAALRQGAHRVADRIYLRLIGQRSAFATRIAYITVEGAPPQRRHRLVVADADGAGARVVLESRRPLMSPAWSPDGRWLAYVSFETRAAAVWIQDLATAERRMVSARPGVNGAPAWSPDGRRLALTLSSPGGNLDIFLLDIAGGALERLTDDPAIDTEPVWSPDGSVVYFTSDRAGGPQGYRMAARAGERPVRVSYGVPYAARPRVSPDGRTLAMVVRDGGAYRVAVQDLSGGGLRMLSRGPQDESPAFSPDGGSIIYGTRDGGRGALATVSVDGLVQQSLVSTGADVREPAWGPFPASAAAPVR
ncbi:MAG: Tol-Pal system beta propeller repeat protein TolB [Gammaproteobacteria bacterium]